MNPPTCQDEDSLNFLVATPRQVSAPEAARGQPEQERTPAPDAFPRLVPRLEPAPETLWGEARTQVRVEQGSVVLDDSPLDKPDAKPRQLVTRQWSGKHHAVGRGITWIPWLWPEGDRHVPCAYRVFEKAQDGLTKNDHCQQRLKVAHTGGFPPAGGVFESWYAGLDNLTRLRSVPWFWLTRLQANRPVNLDRQGLRPLRAVAIGESGRVVWLEGYGLSGVFKLVAPDGDSEYWATNKVERNEWERVKWANFAWTLENDPRGVKPYCVIARASPLSASNSRGLRSQSSVLDLKIWIPATEGRR